MISHPAKPMIVDKRRRNFLRIAGATAIAGTLPLAPWSSMAAGATSDTFTPDVDIELVAQPDELPLLPGRPTAVWRYAGRVLKGPADALQTIAGSYVGPILRLNTGQKVRIRMDSRGPRSTAAWPDCSW